MFRATDFVRRPLSLIGADDAFVCLGVIEDVHAYRNTREADGSVQLTKVEPGRLVVVVVEVANVPAEARASATWVAGFFGGIPGAGETMWTVVNIRPGSVTRLSGTLHRVLLLAGKGRTAELKTGP